MTLCVLIHKYQSLREIRYLHRQLSKPNLTASNLSQGIFSRSTSPFQIKSPWYSHLKRDDNDTLYLFCLCNFLDDPLFLTF